MPPPLQGGIRSGPIAPRLRSCKLLYVKETQRLDRLLANLRRVGTVRELKELHAEVRGLAAAGAISMAAAAGILSARLSFPPIAAEGRRGRFPFVTVSSLDELWKALRSSTTVAELNTLQADVLVQSALDALHRDQYASLGLAIEMKLSRLRRPGPPHGSGKPDRHEG